MFDIIEHKFLVGGHSFLQCDRDFAIIEKRKKKVKAMIPQYLHSIITSSTHTGRFHIVDMANNSFFDIQSVADSILCLKDVNISKVVNIKVDKNYPGILFPKESFSEGAVWKKTPILKKGKKTSDLNRLCISDLPHTNKVGENKKKHLQMMIPYLEKEEHKNFYRDLLHLK